MTSFFNKIGSNAELALAAKKTTFAYYTATHEQSFKSSDYTSELVAKLFEPNFSLGWTKCKAVVVNIIFPICADELCQRMDQVKLCHYYN